MLTYHIYHKGLVFDRDTWIVKDSSKSDILYSITGVDNRGERDIYDDSDHLVATIRRQRHNDWSFRLNERNNNFVNLTPTDRVYNCTFNYIGHKYTWIGTTRLLNSKRQSEAEFDKADFSMKKVGTLEIYGMAQLYEKAILASFVAAWG